MLCIHIQRIPPQGIDIDETVDATDLPLLKTVGTQASVKFVSPVHTRLHAALNGDMVQINGEVATAVRTPCRRCLESFELKIKSAFSVTAVPESVSEDERADANDIELLAEEMDVIAYRGDDIDLRDEIAQQVIMALPFNPLCSRSCRGLCSQCGVNLNAATCQCGPQDGNNPFSVLKRLSFPKTPE